MNKMIVCAAVVTAFVLLAVPTLSDTYAEPTVFESGDIMYQVVDGGEYGVEDAVEVVHSSGSSSSGDSTYSGVITIPAKVKYESKEYDVIGIDNRAFFHSNITSITLSEGLRYVDGGAFAESTLSSITIPATVMRIGNEPPSSGAMYAKSGVFGNSLTELEFESGSQLKYIGPGAFEGISDKDIEIPAGVEDLGPTNNPSDGDPNYNPVPAALLGWWDVKKKDKTLTFASGSPYFIEEGILYKGSVLYACLDGSIKDVNIKAGTVEIEDGAFYCMPLTSIILPEGLETIGDDVFMFDKVDDIYSEKTYDRLNNIIIPTSVRNVGENFLMGALDKSSTVIMEGHVPPFIGDNSFVTACEFLGDDSEDLSEFVVKYVREFSLECPTGTEDSYRKALNSSKIISGFDESPYPVKSEIVQKITVNGTTESSKTEEVGGTTATITETTVDGSTDTKITVSISGDNGIKTEATKTGNDEDITVTVTAGSDTSLSDVTSQLEKMDEVLKGIDEVTGNVSKKEIMIVNGDKVITFTADIAEKLCKEAGDGEEVRVILKDHSNIDITSAQQQVLGDGKGFELSAVVVSGDDVVRTIHELGGWVDAFLPYYPQMGSDPTSSTPPSGNAVKLTF